MAALQFDFKGLKCPVPVLKLSNMMMKKEVNAGDTVTVVADCPTFEKDVKDFCGNHKKVLVRFQANGTDKTAVIQF